MEIANHQYRGPKLLTAHATDDTKFSGALSCRDVALATVNSRRLSHKGISRPLTIPPLLKGPATVKASLIDLRTPGRTLREDEGRQRRCGE